ACQYLRNLSWREPYELLGIICLVFPSGLLSVNLFGWISESACRWNWGSWSATGFAWVVLGFWYGLGYCPCSSWHWMVRRQLGYSEMPSSYVKFLIYQLTGLDLSPELVDAGTVAGFSLALGLSIFMAIRNKSVRDQQA